MIFMRCSPARRGPGRNMTAILSIMCAMCAAGCAGRPADTTAGDAAFVGGASRLTVLDTEAPAPSVARAMLPTLDVAPAPEQWNIGDRVLVEVVSNKVNSTTTRYVLIELTPNYVDASEDAFSAKGSVKDKPAVFSSPTVGTSITVYDELGVKIDESTGRFPLKLLGYGPYDGCMPIAGHPEYKDGANINMPAIPAEETDRMMRGWMSLFGFTGALNRRGPFKELLTGLIARPSLLAMILKPRAQIVFGENDWPEFLPDWTRSGKSVRLIRIPLQLRIADQPALVGEMIACEPLAPLSLCGGLLRAHGYNPVDPRINVQLRLLGTSLGSGGQTFADAPRLSNDH